MIITLIRTQSGCGSILKGNQSWNKNTLQVAKKTTRGPNYNEYHAYKIGSSTIVASTDLSLELPLLDIDEIKKYFDVPVYKAIK